MLNAKGILTYKLSICDFVNIMYLVKIKYSIFVKVCISIWFLSNKHLSLILCHP